MKVPSAEGGIWYNGSGSDSEAKYYRRPPGSNALKPWVGIPRSTESWDAVGRRKKSELLTPKDIKGLLRRCHNKLHGRGSDGEEEDLTMDMVRIILAKAEDEEQPGDNPQFYCTAEEYQTEEGRTIAANRIQTLFATRRDANREVFGKDERITVSDRSICDVVIELQAYRLLADLTKSAEWDVMGHAYEEYTASYLKRRKGQFFTNRLVIEFLTAMLDPDYNDIFLDPAGGSGGFSTSELRYVRRKIMGRNATTEAKQRQLDRARTHIFMIDISPRLVKLAQTASIMNGDGHTLMTCGDSLGPYERLSSTIVAQCSRGVPTLIMTNPPFAGTGDGRVSDKTVLSRFECGKRWVKDSSGWHSTQDYVAEGAPPELLFVERVIDWLAPNGRFGIVLPKSFLDTFTYLPGRALLFSKCQVLAIVSLHKHTFQPHTGVRTCLVLARKLRDGEVTPIDYPIFMAVSRKIGQDSEGVPIYRTDEHGKETNLPDADLDEILADYQAFKKGTLKESEYRFSIRRTDLDELLRINPQLFLPSLNETIKAIQGVEGTKGWSVMTLSQIEQGISIWKCARFKSENMVVEKKVNDTTEPYYTPSAVLQENTDSVKWLDLSRGGPNQLRVVEEIRARKHDIYVTRSGSIGRVVYITSRFDGAIVSDDFVRIRIKDEVLRNYVFAFLQTPYALNQMLRNEYGAIQQHLEPEHVADLLIPIPDDRSVMGSIAERVSDWIKAKEALYKAGTEMVASSLTEMDQLIRGGVGIDLTEEAEL